MLTLSHLDEHGRARMVDAGEKAITQHVAVAQGEITILPETLTLIRDGALKKR